MSDKWKQKQNISSGKNISENENKNVSGKINEKSAKKPAKTKTKISVAAIVDLKMGKIIKSSKK